MRSAPRWAGDEYSFVDRSGVSEACPLSSRLFPRGEGGVLLSESYWPLSTIALSNRTLANLFDFPAVY